MLLINRIEVSELKNYRQEYLECLKQNISNSIISKIVIFVDDPSHNLPNLHGKVDIHFKKNNSIYELINSVKKLYSSDTIIWIDNPIIGFNSDLYKISPETKNFVVTNSKRDYFIFKSDTPLSDVPMSEGIFPLKRKNIELYFFRKKITGEGQLPTQSDIKRPEKPTTPVITIRRPIKIESPEKKKFKKDLGTLDLIKKKSYVPETKESYPVQIKNAKLDIVIVSVNYNDLLILSLQHNSKIFENITVVTSEDDILCQKICQKFGVNCVVTNVMYENGDVFNKGKAINEGIKSLINPDFILLIDADIIIKNKIEINSFNRECLYTSDRWFCKSYQMLRDWQEGRIPLEKIGRRESNKGIGFFQLFNINSKSIDKETPYPENSKNASWSDLLFRDKFTKREDIRNTIIHLGESYKNWDGRISIRFLTDDEFASILDKEVEDVCPNEWGVISVIPEKSKYGSLNLKNQKSFDYHRSGWTSVIKQMWPLNSTSGIRTECFLDSNFCWRGSENKVISEKWIGFIHNPIDTDSEYLKTTMSKEIFSCENFIKSLDNCVGLYVFSDIEKNKIILKLKNLNLSIKVESIKHPTEKSDIKWSFEDYKKEKKLLHVGWWMRDVKSFYEIDIDIKKIRIKLNYKIESFLRKKFNLKSADVNEISKLDNEMYDYFLSNSIVFINLIDSVANNTILECIERSTPIIVNRHPSVIEYLGLHYPLYFDDIKDVKYLLDDNKIKAANQYLKNLKVEYSITKQIENSEIYRSISKTKTLFLPGDLKDSEGGIYNPGFALFNNKYWLLPRVEKFTEKERGQNNLWKISSSIPTIVEVSESFEIKRILDLTVKNWFGNRIEDFRLFSHKDKLYSNHIFVDDNSIYPVISHIDIEEKVMTILGKIEIDLRIKNVEKNWTFIDIEGRLFLIYSISPLRVFEVNIDTLTSKSYKSNNIDIKWSKEGYVSASTNPILLSDGNILMGFHSRDKDKVYHQGFILFDKNFEILRQTTVPYLSGGDYDGINKNVIYTMSIKEEGDDIYCICGDGDYKSIIFKISKNEIWKELL